MLFSHKNQHKKQWFILMAVMLLLLLVIIAFQAQIYATLQDLQNYLLQSYVMDINPLPPREVDLIKDINPLPPKYF